MGGSGIGGSAMRTGILLTTFGAAVLAAVACSSSGNGGGGGPTPTPTGTTYTWTDNTGYQAPAGSEHYMCFYVDMPTGTGVGATSFSYNGGANGAMLHHLVIFTTSDTTQANGSYSDCTSQPFQLNWTIRYAGGRNTGALQLPANVAMPMAGPTQRFVFQLHLTNASTSAVADTSTVTIGFTRPGRASRSPR